MLLQLPNLKTAKIMEHHVRRFLNRLSLFLSIVSTLSLFHVYYSTTSISSCGGGPHHNHPTTSCALQSRDLLSPSKRFRKISSSKSYIKRYKLFLPIFQTLKNLKLLNNSSHVLVVAAGAAHEVVALHESGVEEVTAVDLVEFLPYVKRSDPHNLPFFDEVFDVGFSSGLDQALFPKQFVEEMERCVKVGGAEAIVIERLESEAELEEVKSLFRRSRLVQVKDVSLDGQAMSLIVMKNVGNFLPPG